MSTLKNFLLYVGTILMLASAARGKGKRKLAFIEKERGKDPVLCTMNTNGSDRKKVVDLKGLPEEAIEKTKLVWSPDGGKIVVQPPYSTRSDHDPRVVDLRSGKLTKIIRRRIPEEWEKEKDKLSPTERMRRELDKRGRDEPFLSVPFFRDRFIGWSSDNKLYVIRDVKGAEDRVVIIDPDKGKEKTLPSLEGKMSVKEVFRDGVLLSVVEAERNKDIALTAQVDNCDASEIIGPDFFRLTCHSADDYSPIRSPSGKAIVFKSKRNKLAYGDLYLITLGRREVKRLTREPGYKTPRLWVSDNEIVYSSDDFKGREEHFLLDVEDGTKKPLKGKVTSGTSDALYLTEEGEIIKVDKTGSTKLTETPDIEEHNPTLSPASVN